MAVTQPSTTTAPRPPGRRSVGRLVWPTLLVAGACAATPNLRRAVTVHPGERTTVRMVQFNGGRMFTLQNASSGSAHDVYKNKRSDPLTKVVDDELLQRLLDVLAERGLFETATPAAPSSARDALIIDHNSPGAGSRRYVIHREGLPLAEAQRYLEAKKYFLDVYNRAEAFHTADINRTDLRNEGDRVRYDADRARRKLERLKERGK